MSNNVEQSQAVRAYQLIEELIVNASLTPGTKVSEKGLSERLGLGRTPVREALQRLAAEGTVTVVPRAGVIISPIDITDQFRLIEVRRELERLLAVRAARLATADERQRFSELAAHFTQSGENGDAEHFIQTDRDFNQLVASSARNKYALLAMAPIQAQTRRFWFQYFSRFGDLGKVCQLHAGLAAAIASGGEEAAKSASDALIDYVESYTRKTLEVMCAT